MVMYNYKWYWETRCDLKTLRSEAEIKLDLEKEIRKQLVQKAQEKGYTVYIDSIYIELERISSSWLPSYIAKSTVKFRSDAPPPDTPSPAGFIEPVTIATIIILCITAIVTSLAVYYSLQTIKSIIEEIPPIGRVMLTASIFIGVVLIALWAVPKLIPKLRKEKE